LITQDKWLDVKWTCQQIISLWWLVTAVRVPFTTNQVPLQRDKV